MCKPILDMNMQSVIVVYIIIMIISWRGILHLACSSVRTPDGPWLGTLNFRNSLCPNYLPLWSHAPLKDHNEIL